MVIGVVIIMVVVVIVVVVVVRDYVVGWRGCCYSCSCGKGLCC